MPLEEAEGVANGAPVENGELGITVVEKKERGNSFFNEQRFVEAALCYTECIALLTSDSGGYKDNALLAVVRLNLATCFVRMDKNLPEAVDLCTEVINMEPSNVKALFRRAAAQHHIAKSSSSGQDFKKNALLAAKKDLMQAAKMDSGNRKVRALMEEVNAEAAAAGLKLEERESQRDPDSARSSKKPQYGKLFGKGLYADKKIDAPPLERPPPPKLPTPRKRAWDDGDKEWLALRSAWLRVPQEKVAKLPESFEDPGPLQTEREASGDAFCS